MCVVDVLTVSYYTIDMTIIAMYPFLLLRYYFFEIPFRLLRFFIACDVYVLNFLSVPVLIMTFFKPLKNEYRKDLVAFSIGMGIVVKTVLICISLVFLLFLIIFELFFFIFLYVGPVYFLLSLYW